jgi:hypothetical protein
MMRGDESLTRRYRVSVLTSFLREHFFGCGVSRAV